MGSFMPMRPGAPPGGTFAPPRPPPSPRVGDADGLAEQGGPALFKPASTDTVAAAAAAAAAGSAPKNGGASGEAPVLSGCFPLAGACARCTPLLGARQPAAGCSVLL